MEKLVYIAPEIEVFEIQIEKGFGTSVNPSDLDDFGYGGW